MDETQQQVYDLRVAIAEAIDQYAEANPSLPARSVVTALAESMVNIGIRQLGKEHMVNFIKSLVEITEKSGNE